MSKFNLITPDSIWTTPKVDEFVPLHPSGCSFIDVLAEKVRKRGHAPVVSYAKYMGVDYLLFCHTLQTLSGITAAQWIDRIVMLDNEWWLLNTMLNIKDIAKNRGYGSGSIFARAWKRRYKLSPEEYRHQHRKIITHVTNEIKIQERS